MQSDRVGMDENLVGKDSDTARTCAIPHQGFPVVTLWPRRKDSLAYTGSCWRELYHEQHDSALVFEESFSLRAVHCGNFQHGASGRPQGPHWPQFSVSGGSGICSSYPNFAPTERLHVSCARAIRALGDGRVIWTTTGFCENLAVEKVVRCGSHPRKTRRES